MLNGLLLPNVTHCIINIIIEVIQEYCDILYTVLMKKAKIHTPKMSISSTSMTLLLWLGDIE